MDASVREYIIENYDSVSVAKLRLMVNEEFGLSYKESAFYEACRQLGLNKHVQHRYTDEEEAYLRDNAPRMTRRELTESFNKRFGTSIKENAIVMRCWKKGYKPMTDGKFKQVSVPWEKTEGGKEAYLKTLPRAPLGKETAYNGWTFVRTEEGRIPKHRLIWEQAHGKLDRNDVILFADGDKTNFDLSNLRKVSNSVMVSMKLLGWLDHKAILDTGINWFRLKEVFEANL